MIKTIKNKFILWINKIGAYNHNDNKYCTITHKLNKNANDLTHFKIVNMHYLLYGIHLCLYKYFINKNVYHILIYDKKSFCKHKWYNLYINDYKWYSELWQSIFSYPHVISSGKWYMLHINYIFMAKKFFQQLLT